MDKALSGQTRIKIIRTYEVHKSWFKPDEKRLVREFQLMQVQLASGEWVNAIDNPLNVIEEVTRA